MINDTRLKIGVVSLGCPKNLVDTEIMIGLAAKNGFIFVEDQKDADAVIINTCCFIKEAAEEAYGVINEFSSLRENGAIKRLIVAGCLPQRLKSGIISMFPAVDKFVGTGDFASICEHLISASGEGGKLQVSRPEFIYDADTPRVNSLGEGSAYLKIAEGCSEQCSFCIVPKLRGRARSRPIDDIVREAKNLVEGGVVEINLIAQNLTAYGRDMKKEDLLTVLLKELCRIEDLRWIRLLYNYPRDFSKGLIDMIAGEGKICKYIDLPIQHIDDDILRSMNRNTSSEMIRTLLDRLKERIEGLVIRSSFIVGFPGETEAKFSELVRFIRHYAFDKIAVFPYSHEEGTAAFKLADSIGRKTKETRYDILTKIKNETAFQKNRRFKGITLSVLVEELTGEGDRSIAKGRFYGQAPEIDGNVYFDAKGKTVPGKMADVKILKSDEYDLYGELSH